MHAATWFVLVFAPLRPPGVPGTCCRQLSAAQVLGLTSAPLSAYNTPKILLPTRGRPGCRLLPFLREVKIAPNGRARQWSWPVSHPAAAGGRCRGVFPTC